MKNKGIFTIMFAGMLLFSSCSILGESSGDGSSSSSNTAVVGMALPDYDAKADELGVHLMGWVTPTTMDREQLGYVVESGVDTLFYITNTYTASDSTVSTLELCKEFGIDVYLTTGVKDGSAIANIANLTGMIRQSGLRLTSRIRKVSLLLLRWSTTLIPFRMIKHYS